MNLIVGLGNHGNKYSKNRHNIGFMTIDKIVSLQKTTDISKSIFRGELRRFDDVLLLKPHTFMNLSGESVLAVTNYFKEIEKIIVIHDEIEIPFGAIRFKIGGGNGGHNGLKSLDKHITNNYIRVRVGVGKPIDKNDIADYVLSDFSKDEQSKLNLDYITEATMALLSCDVESVSSKFTKKGL